MPSNVAALTPGRIEEQLVYDWWNTTCMNGDENWNTQFMRSLESMKLFVNIAKHNISDFFLDGFILYD